MVVPSANKRRKKNQQEKADTKITGREGSAYRGTGTYLRDAPLKKKKNAHAAAPPSPPVGASASSFQEQHLRVASSLLPRFGAELERERGPGQSGAPRVRRGARSRRLHAAPPGGRQSHFTT